MGIDKMIEEAISRLKSVRVVETGKPFFNIVRRVSDTEMRDNYLEGRIEIMLKCNPAAYGPDLHVQVGDSVYTMDDITEIKGISGKHTNMGMFVISGPDFMNGVLLPASNTMTARVLRADARAARGRLKNLMFRGLNFFNLYEEVTTLDLTPTLLYMFDLPVGRDMDGRPLTSYVRDEVLKGRGVAYIDSYDYLQKDSDEPVDATMSEEEMDRLRALGYIK